jgi:hypothetical protein
MAYSVSNTSSTWQSVGGGGSAMKKVEIMLPEDAEEYHKTVLGVRAVFWVMMKDGRKLQVTYSLVPRYDCAGNQAPESATECPVCGWPL